MSGFYFDTDNRFVIENYTQRRPFASFLPGIAGVMGIPMWTFYVNRGQAIVSAGIENKDSAMMEFLPASKAYQQVAYTGFRTFIQIKNYQKPPDFFFYEPFSAYPAVGIQRQMAIGMNELEIQEICPAHQLQVTVLYFNLTDEPFAGLVRQVAIQNQSDSEITLSLLDGLPMMISFGVNDGIMKNMARTGEAWMGVFNHENNLPFYRVIASIGDTVEIEGYQAGHFYLAFTENEKRLPAIVDSRAVFGQNTTFSQPNEFLKKPLNSLYQSPQITTGRMPCAFAGTEHTLPPGETFTLYAVMGHISDLESAENISERIATPAYIQEKHRAASHLANELTDTVAIQTAEPLLDAYTRQTFLDNVLRGGWPVILNTRKKPFVQHVYSRKHGDLERDYNAFYLAAEFYSQGNGNFRDVNQNRREDVWLNPQVKDYNIITFMNLIQADGYNPLVVRGNRYIIPPEKRQSALQCFSNPAEMESFFENSFTPGELLKNIMVRQVQILVPQDDFLDTILSVAEQHFEADFGEGYWIDHWTYNLDLIENYLTIYPDDKYALLFERPVFTFYDSPAIVRPRDEKYILKNGQIRQLNAVYEDKEKATLIASRAVAPHVMRTDNGQGDIFSTTLFVKLLSLALNKFTLLDPEGMGIEMEAGKPGWDDAMNGLPGMFGSAMPETYELARLLAFIRNAIAEAKDPDRAIELPVEIYVLLHTTGKALKADVQQTDNFVYWNSIATARESYRAHIRLGFSGKLKSSSLSEIDGILALCEQKVQAGIARAESFAESQSFAESDNRLPPTYFVYQVVDYEKLASPAEGQYFVRVKKWEKARPLPAFLEGAVRQLKIQTESEVARTLYNRVKKSVLFDEKLKMYRLNASLADWPHDIGRVRAFTPGWLENETIWLHMEYKYLLATLDAGLFEEFYTDFKNTLIPFLNPEIYGRSPLENSSFIASSAHPDESLHGGGFVARLSGSTVEFLSILHRLMIGKQPFFIQDGELHLQFRPALPDWLFRENGTLSCTFLGHIRLTYHNPERKNTYGEKSVFPERFVLKTPDGEYIEITGSEIIGQPARRVRNRYIEAIDIFLQ